MWAPNLVRFKKVWDKLLGKAWSLCIECIQILHECINQHLDSTVQYLFPVEFYQDDLILSSKLLLAKHTAACWMLNMLGHCGKQVSCLNHLENFKRNRQPNPRYRSASLIIRKRSAQSKASSQRAHLHQRTAMPNGTVKAKSQLVRWVYLQLQVQSNSFLGSACFLSFGDLVTNAYYIESYIWGEPCLCW